MSLQPKGAVCAPMQVCNDPRSSAVTSTAIYLTTSTITTTATATVSTACLTTSSATLQRKASSANINTSAAALPEKQNKNNEYVKSAVQTGMDRNIQMKRKLSPLNSQRKITRGNASLAAIETPMNTNQFLVLADASDVEEAEST